MGLVGLANENGHILHICCQSVSVELHINDAFRVHCAADVIKVVIARSQVKAEVNTLHSNQVEIEVVISK